MRFTLATLAWILCATLSFAQKAVVQQTPPPVTQAQIDAAIDRGAVFLLRIYGEQFDSNRLENQERAGQSALSLYTMIQAGVSRENPTLRRLLTHVLNQRFEHTYDAGCALLALHAGDGIEFRRWIEALAQQLIAWQKPSIRTHSHRSWQWVGHRRVRANGGRHRGLRASGRLPRRSLDQLVPPPIYLGHPLPRLYAPDAQPE
jgi:hypothetical protein